MKRRNLIRGVATSSLLALGAAGAAGKVTDSPDGGPTHLAIRQDDGTYEVVPAGSGGVGPEYYPCGSRCNTYCCEDCPDTGCECCSCRDCSWPN